MSRRLAAFLATVVCSAVAATASPASADAGVAEVEKRLVAEINDARAAHGVRRVRLATRLNRGARGWAWHLLRANSFYHGRLASGTSENLAWGTCRSLRPSRVVKMWLASPAHRSNMLSSRWRRVGTGWASGDWRGYNCIELAVARFR